MQALDSGTKRNGLSEADLDVPAKLLEQCLERGEEAQFEDDLKQFSLPAYTVIDLSLRRPIQDHLDLFLSVENLFDEKIVTGRLPVEALGAPRLIQLGITVRR